MFMMKGGPAAAAAVLGASCSSQVPLKVSVGFPDPVADFPKLLPKLGVLILQSLRACHSETDERRLGLNTGTAKKGSSRTRSFKSNFEPRALSHKIILGASGLQDPPFPFGADGLLELMTKIAAL